MIEKPVPEGVLERLLAGRRVLFVNGIRSDQPSGGNTATQSLLSRWRESGLCELIELSLNPDQGESERAFAIKTFPSALFVLWGRATGQVWLEFFRRVSPWLWIRCLWARWYIRPDVVIFNHHASFVFLGVFKGLARVLVWHDVPSLKQVPGIDRREDARRCAGLERCFNRQARHAVTFSFDDARALSLLHRIKPVVMPVIDGPAQPRDCEVRPGQWLLIGNWARIENAEGAEAFLRACADMVDRGQATASAGFHIAGHGSDAFVRQVIDRCPAVARLTLRVTARFDEVRDFDETALLAPLRQGAGIKLKTVEAWAAGIPVLGTAQAFTGLPASLWRRGGHRVDSVETLARLCLTEGALAVVLAELRPLEAYESYQVAIRQTAAPSCQASSPK